MPNYLIKYWIWPDRESNTLGEILEFDNEEDAAEYAEEALQELLSSKGSIFVELVDNE